MNVMKKNKTMKKPINLGLSILRMVLAFLVVIVHLKVDNRKLMKIIYKKNFHVPTFMIMSFYFFSNNLFSRNINNMKTRFIRLLIPYIIWPLIKIFFINILFVSKKIVKLYIIKKILLQIIFGREIHAVFWYLHNLIIITILFEIISFLFKKHLFLAYLYFSIIAYLLQYTEINYYYFVKYKVIIAYSLGHISEMIPIALSGITLGKLKIIEKLKNFKYNSILICILILYIILIKDIFIKPKGFQYQGINLNVEAIVFFILFANIPIINNKIIKCILINLTNYTGGIYYLHTFVNTILQNKLSLFKKKTLLRIILNYWICYIICFLGIKLFNKYKLKYLFY